ISNLVHPNISSSGIDTSLNVNRFWAVSADSMTFNNATITLSWPASALDPGVNTSQLRVGRWGGSGWSYPVTTNPTSTSIELTGISNTSSGNYVVGELLPVVNIPDANFKAALVANAAINTNSDTEIQVSEAEAYTGAINVINLNIADRTGIEAFTQLTALDCNTKNLTSLDVS